MPAREVASYVRRRKRTESAQFAHACSHVQVQITSSSFVWRPFVWAPSRVPPGMYVQQCRFVYVWTGRESRYLCRACSNVCAGQEHGVINPSPCGNLMGHTCTCNAAGQL